MWEVILLVGGERGAIVPKDAPYKWHCHAESHLPYVMETESTPPVTLRHDPWHEQEHQPPHPCYPSTCPHCPPACIAQHPAHTDSSYNTPHLISIIPLIGSRDEKQSPHGYPHSHPPHDPLHPTPHPAHTIHATSIMAERPPHLPPKPPITLTLKHARSPLPPMSHPAPMWSTVPPPSNPTRLTRLTPDLVLYRPCPHSRSATRAMR